MAEGAAAPDVPTTAAEGASSEDVVDDAPSKSGGLSSSAAAECTSPRETVQFNVGGRIYEVLREPTLSLYPDCLLNTLAEESSGGEPIFVEADPDLFQYILQYLRGRKMCIPVLVSIKAVIDEAAKIGLVVEEKDIEREVLPIGVWCRAAQASQRKAKEALQEHVEALKLAYLQVVADLVAERVTEKMNCEGQITVALKDLRKDSDFSLDRPLNADEVDIVLKLLDPWLQAQGLKADKSGSYAGSGGSMRFAYALVVTLA
mmetsp:Transcript_22753/g.65450  ORF Transcript_22753/g.65450 Transcript_22753/m.65450 type:complete len:260 (-) Transcript_22753:118-897(-)